MFQVIYSVKDSGELVLPSPDQTILRRSDPVEQELVRRDDPVQEYNLVYAVDNRWCVIMNTKRKGSLNIYTKAVNLIIIIFDISH